ncbi:MAG TPA: class II aldolase/adducin family protein [Acidimicrobiales bacterium]
MTATDVTATDPTATGVADVASAGAVPVNASGPAADRARLVEEATLDAAHGFRTLRETGTLPDGATIGLLERVPGEPVALAFRAGGPGLVAGGALTPTERPLGGSPVADDAGGPADDDTRGLEAVLARHPDLTTVVYVRSPHLVAWAQTKRPLPIRYVPVQRWTLARELPIRTDPARSLADAIDDALAAEPHTPAILDAGGGAVVWGRNGLLRTLEYLQLVEEGAQFQILAQQLGGSKPVGPGVLVQQWRMSGLIDRARAEGRLDD